MTKILERNRAIELRRQGKSYSEIKADLPVSKSSLSLWLKDYPLTKIQIDKFRDKRPAQIEKFINTMRVIREEKFKSCYEDAKRLWLPLSRRELLLAGIFLYWGEGGKTNTSITVSNTDPRVLQFVLIWMTKALDIPRSKIKVLLHLYHDMDTQKETRYWSKVLNMGLTSFNRPYIKNSLIADLTQKGFGHGTCNIIACKADIKRKIMATIAVFADHYSVEASGDLI